MENCLERMARIDARRKIADFMVKEQLDLWPLREAVVQRACGLTAATILASPQSDPPPFAIFSRQDLLQLALDLNVPVPEIYGAIERKEDGTLYTTKAQRTGCSMCGFGIHLEKRPRRFDLLKERDPKEWHYWMYECCADDNGEKFGWARVLDYIGVGY